MIKIKNSIIDKALLITGIVKFNDISSRSIAVESIPR